MIQDLTITSQHLESQLLKREHAYTKDLNSARVVQKGLKAFSCEWKRSDRCTARVDFVKGGKRTQSALKCELWSQAAGKETLWSRKMMCFPAKWLRVSGRTLEYLLLREHRPRLQSKMVTAQVFGAAHQPLSVNILCCDQILYYILTVHSMNTLDALLF